MREADLGEEGVYCTGVKIVACWWFFSRVLRRFEAGGLFGLLSETQRNWLTPGPCCLLLESEKEKSVVPCLRHRHPTPLPKTVQRPRRSVWSALLPPLRISPLLVIPPTALETTQDAVSVLFSLSLTPGS